MATEVDDPMFAMLEGLTETPKLAKRSPAALSLEQEQQKRLDKVRTDLHEKAAGVVSAALDFSEIDPAATEPPAEWVDLYGAEVAAKRFRVAQAAWMNGKSAPAGLKVATDTLMGLESVRSRIQAPSVVLNVGKVEMNFQMPVFEEEEVGGNESE